MRLAAIFWFTWLSQVFFLWPIIIGIFLVRDYRFANVRAARREYFDIINKEKAPYLICANHLCWMDPFLVAWIIAPPWRGFFRPGLFPWGVVGKKYADKLIFKPVFFVTRTIVAAPDKEINKKNWRFQSSTYLLSTGQYIFMFPEGRRSPTGRVVTESTATGVGYLAKSVPGSKIICTYVRGEDTATKVNMPAKHQKFHLHSELLDLSPEKIEAMSTRDITQNVIDKLAQMERAYFEKMKSKT